MVHSPSWLATWYWLSAGSSARAGDLFLRMRSEGLLGPPHSKMAGFQELTEIQIEAYDILWCLTT